MTDSSREIESAPGELDTGLTPDASAAAPAVESGNNGSACGVSSDVSACVAEALARLATTGRDARGRFTQDNTEAGVSLARSEAFWRAVAPVERELSTTIGTDLGLGDDAPEGLRRLVSALAQVSIGRQGLWLKVLEAGGPVTRGGRKRQLWADYLSAVGVEAKLYRDLLSLPKVRDGRAVGRGESLEAALAREPEAR